MGPQKRPKKKGKLDMKNKQSIQRMVGIASLAAITAVLGFIANYVQIGTFSLNLTLIPLVIGAILYGPLAGTILGTLIGAIILVAPSTQGFLSINPFATVVLCLAKTALAGCAAGWIFKVLWRVNLILAIVLATISAPIVNTGLFAVGCFTFFLPTMQAMAADSATNVLTVVFVTMIGFNFFIEFAINVILSPTVIYIVRVISRNYNLGTSFNIGAIYKEEEIKNQED